MRSSIPDLRCDHQEFTLEHCSVLAEALKRFLQAAYDPEVSEIVEEIDLDQMREDLLTIGANQLNKLFTHEYGKAFLAGLFFGHFILQTEEESED